jgi:hypothetical protein|tara:strand:- start:320 stop:592 length:273 start_codon:yes stop_codon:yes gene_type:complete
MAKLTDGIFKSRRVKIYQVSRQFSDDRKNLPNNYRINILKNSISSHIFRNNQMFDFIIYIQEVVANWVDAVNGLKVFKSYTVKKDDKNIR